MKNKNRKQTPVTRERRSITHKIEIRKASDGSRTIVGYASVFAPARSENLGGFYEQIDPHAFDECLASNPDVRALWNHDANHVLGRTLSGTLKLTTDSVGLRYECKLPDTQAANDLAESMSRGDVNQASFGFVCLDDKWEQTSDSQLLRTVLKAELFDVSPVTYAAYSDATAAIRSMPAELRAKLTAASRRKDVIDAILDEPDNDDSDDDGDSDNDDSDDCDCDCDECQADDCENCSNPDCEDEQCSDCPAQTRAAHLELIARKLR